MGQGAVRQCLRPEIRLIQLMAVVLHNGGQCNTSHSVGFCLWMTMCTSIEAVCMFYDGVHVCCMMECMFYDGV